MKSQGQRREVDRDAHRGTELSSAPLFIPSPRIPLHPPHSAPLSPHRIPHQEISGAGGVLGVPEARGATGAAGGAQRYASATPEKFDVNTGPNPGCRGVRFS